jgi:PTH2 family peptidyl-tRNA hydrolase
MKQIIIMRKDLGMRAGKMVAQGAHASMGACLPYLNTDPTKLPDGGWAKLCKIHAWLAGSFKKVTLRVESEEQLLAVHKVAQEAGLIECLITDSGLTEFHGVPTITCCAIGPDIDEALDPITGELKLL